MSWLQQRMLQRIGMRSRIDNGLVKIKVVLIPITIHMDRFVHCWRVLMCPISSPFLKRRSAVVQTENDQILVEQLKQSGLSLTHTVGVRARDQTRNLLL